MAAAVVAALIVVVGVMISDRLLGIHVLTPDGSRAYTSTATTGYAISAAVAALIATLLLYVLMLSAPEPAKFFGWIAGLFTVIITILPFMYTAGAIQQVATAIINLVVGIAIVSLLMSISRGAIEDEPDPEPYPYEQSRGYDDRGYDPREDQPRRYSREYEQDQRGYDERGQGRRGYDDQQRGYERRNRDPYN